MKQHIVKCKCCGESFDLNQVQGVRVGKTRYGHASCYPDSKDFVPMGEPTAKPAEDKELTQLKAYISQVYGDKVNWKLVTKQIKDFKQKNGYSYSGMLKSLTYFYDVKKNSTEKSNGGIGIIEYVYNEAYNYYLALFIAKNQNTNISKEKFLNNQKEIEISSVPRRNKKIKLLSMDWDED